MVRCFFVKYEGVHELFQSFVRKMNKEALEARKTIKVDPSKPKDGKLTSYIEVVN